MRCCAAAWTVVGVFQSAAASWTRRNRAAANRRGAPVSFQSAAASWTRRNSVAHDGPLIAPRFNPPPRRGRGGMTRRRNYLRQRACFNPPPRRGRGGIVSPVALSASGQVSIRRRVVDAAESCALIVATESVAFQSAAASWTRRNGHASPTFPDPDVSIRRRVVDAAEWYSWLAVGHLHMFQSAAASWTRRNETMPR